MLANAASEGEAGSFTLKEFQRRHNLSDPNSTNCAAKDAARARCASALSACASPEADRDWIAAREQEAMAAARETAPTENETSAPEEERPSDDFSNCPPPTGRQRAAHAE